MDIVKLIFAILYVSVSLVLLLTLIRVNTLMSLKHRLLDCCDTGNYYKLPEGYKNLWMNDFFTLTIKMWIKKYNLELK